MTKAAQNIIHSLASFFQPISAIAMCILAIALVAYTISCGLGHSAWLHLPLTFGNTTYADAGIFVQSGVTAFAASMLFYLPSNMRVMALETSHRRFLITMDDVTGAYHQAHRADRENTFKLKSEYDSIRERMAFLNQHPDLAELEPNVMEVAAQMSHVSRQLAETYSDKNVIRARDFLIQRQEEIETFNERLDAAKATTLELRKWLGQVEMDEAVANAQLARLREELRELMPELLNTPLPEEYQEMLEPALPKAVGDSHMAETAPHDAEVIPDDPRIVSLLAMRKQAQ